jgi:hypothetical protein
MSERQILASSASAGTFFNIPVLVINDGYVIHNGELYSGYYQPAVGVTLSSSGRSLCHELLHALDYKRGKGPPSLHHLGWDQNGFFNADDQYKQIASDISTPP